MYHLLAFYFDKFWPQLNKGGSSNQHQGIQGIGGIPVLAQSRPQVSKSEYEDLFKVRYCSISLHHIIWVLPLRVMDSDINHDGQSPISTDETAMEMNSPLVEALWPASPI
ncbi:hypothetical protein JCM33374_g6638 [Metschnikowia sp. JCM 33374]|nr:hypothetical protein JCM33374_g6638 [Metschnikowia sp. JCM 33374]